MGAPGSPWFGSGSDGSPAGAVGDTLLGGTVDDAPLGGPVGPASWEPGGLDLTG